MKVSFFQASDITLHENYKTLHIHFRRDADLDLIDRKIDVEEHKGNDAFFLFYYLSLFFICIYVMRDILNLMQFDARYSEGLWGD